MYYRITMCSPEQFEEDPRSYYKYNCMLCDTEEDATEASAKLDILNTKHVILKIKENEND